MALSQALHLGSRKRKLSHSEANSIFYHSIFNYPLTKKDLARWVTGEKIKPLLKDTDVLYEKGFYFLKKDDLYKRQLNSSFSRRKLTLAKRAALSLGKIPSVKSVVVTGSLAMENAGEDSDIDLMIIVSKGTLWITRAFSYLMLIAARFPLRRVGESKEKDRLCLNIWMDESDLSWVKKNIFTAHEILQTRSILDCEGTYKKFLDMNAWSADFWPNAKMTGKSKRKKMTVLGKLVVALFAFLEPFAFWAEYLYMRNKITKEIVTPTRALFHPYDWSRFVSSKIKPL